MVPRQSSDTRRPVLPNNLYFINKIFDYLLKKNMALKLLILAFSFHSHTTLDTVPALHNIREADIDTAIASYKGKTLTVKLKTGKTYVYTEAQYGKEDWSDGVLPRKLQRPILALSRTFTKSEVPPTFPGGPTAWDEYQRKVCSENSRLIKRKGPATVYVQFIVAFDGTIDQVQVQNDAPHGLEELAIRMIEKGPAWEPAMQNGYKVTAYARQKIDFQ